MALRETLNNLAATASSRANNAIETGRLHIKISNEERKITEFILSIGELALDKLDAGETFDDEIMALYSSVQASREVIAEAQATIESYRPITVEPVCAACGAAISEDAKYCAQCGAKVEPPEAEPTCPSCGTPLEEDAKFCTSCGTKVEEEKTEE